MLSPSTAVALVLVLFPSSTALPPHNSQGYTSSSTQGFLRMVPSPVRSGSTIEEFWDLDQLCSSGLIGPVKLIGSSVVSALPPLRLGWQTRRGDRDCGDCVGVADAKCQAEGVTSWRRTK